MRRNKNVSQSIRSDNISKVHSQKIKVTEVASPCKYTKLIIKIERNLPSTTSTRFKHPAVCKAWRVCVSDSLSTGFFSFNFSYRKRNLLDKQQIALK
jgi:hypothetical protein